MSAMKERIYKLLEKAPGGTHDGPCILREEVSFL